MPCCIAPAWDNTFSIPTKNLPSSRQEIVPGNSSESPFPIPPKLLHDRWILYLFFRFYTIRVLQSGSSKAVSIHIDGSTIFSFCICFVCKKRFDSLGVSCYYLSQPVASRHTPVPQGQL